MPKKAKREKIDFGWETQKEKLQRSMTIPAVEKLTWLRKMHEFTLAVSSKRMLKLRINLKKLQTLS